MTIQTPPPNADLAAMMTDMGTRARAASSAMAPLPAQARTSALLAMADEIETARDVILQANAADMAAGKSKGLSAALMDRLALDEKRVDAIAGGLRAVAELPDPVGRELARWSRPNGLDIARVACPLGVIGIIYESRPNVTADAGALCVRSGNAAILRCGSESLNSSGAIAAAMRRGLARSGLPEDAVQLVNTADRDAVGHILSGLSGQMDVVVPRGGKGLVQRVQDEARIPVIGHLEGLCHIYVHTAADLQTSKDVILNAKMRRPGICGAVETVLVDRAVSHLLPQLLQPLADAGCELRVDEAALGLLEAAGMEATLATPEDWRTEYLAPILSVGLVEDQSDAERHIARYGTQHTEAILTEDNDAAERFLANVDAGIVMHNTSTQFADGGEFGMGAEIGIATGRIHARGPVGADQLTIFKYVVRGRGQTRP
ncbi:MAG: glutamate-5-semialdehyde dehydrogenase [Pseudomonadota bacterium]